MQIIWSERAFIRRQAIEDYILYSFGYVAHAKYIEEVSLEDYRILYLTQLPKERITSYEKNAIANINPRPINKELDEKSVPSKLIEYLSIGVPTISTKYEGLYHLFEDDVFWVEDNTQKSLTESLEKFEKTSDALKIKKASSAKAKAFEMYSLDIQGELITHFLISLNK